MQMAVAGLSVYTLSGTRAFIVGESLWSKGQHEADYYLSLYVDNGDPKDFASFRRAIAVPLAYERGREALEDKTGPSAAVRRAFIEGGTSAVDIPAGIWMFKTFRGFPYLENALSRWKQTDKLIIELRDLGEAIGAEHPISNPVLMRDRIETIDKAITPLATAFSRSLDDGARVVERILLIANVALAGLLAALTIWRVGKFLTQRRQAEDALAWQASHDDLTGLANRRAFETRLTMALQPTRDANPASHALLYIDLDQFKIINDTCGHAAGDALLRRICVPLRQALGPHDLLARLGGDEFSVLMPNIDVKEAAIVAEKMRSIVEKVDFRWNGRTFGVTASIGLVHAEAERCSPERMLTKADMACFMAKEKGRNRVHSHRDEDQELLGREQEMNWVQRIQQALSEERFCLYAQEIVPLIETDDSGLHLEVLIRMRDEHGGLIPPSSFIPAAERFGLMKLIDQWVVSRTFKVLAERRLLKGKAAITCCAINLSGATIGDAEFLGFLKQAFASYKIPPEIICFEVTETTAIVNLAAACAFIHELRDFGCTFALDDFGSGMSSFNYLKEIPVDYLKIDGAFVKNLLSDRPDRAMVEMISHVGHIMGKRIIAEFVETEALAEALRDIGVDYAQGFGIAKPISFDAHFEGVATLHRVSMSEPKRLSA